MNTVSLEFPKYECKRREPGRSRWCVFRRAKGTNAESIVRDRMTKGNAETLRDHYNEAVLDASLQAAEGLLADWIRSTAQFEHRDEPEHIKRIVALRTQIKQYLLNSGHAEPDLSA